MQDSVIIQQPHVAPPSEGVAQSKTNFSVKFLQESESTLWFQACEMATANRSLQLTEEMVAQSKLMVAQSKYMGVKPIQIWIYMTGKIDYERKLLCKKKGGNRKTSRTKSNKCITDLETNKDTWKYGNKQKIEELK